MNRADLKKVKSRISSAYNKMSLSKRAVAFFIFSVILPIFLILQLYSQRSFNIIENELASNMQLAVNQIKNNLDYRFEQIKESAFSMLSTAYPYVRSGSTDYSEQMEEYKKLKLLVAAYEGKHMISKVRLYVPADKIYANQQDTFYSLPDMSKLTDTNSQYSYERGVVWMDTYGARIYEGGGLTNVISFRMTISSRTNYDEIASVLQLDIEETKLSKTFSAGINTNEEIYLVNSKGVIISHPNPSLIGQKGLSDAEMKEALAKGKGHMSDSSAHDDHMVAYTKLDAMDWYLIMRIPSSTVYGSNVFSFDFSRILLILAVLVVFTIALILVYSLVIENSVRKINHAITQLNHGGIEKVESLFKQDTNSKNPLMSLENNTNALVVKVKTLMEESYEAQLKVHEYHLKALQAQINPHFLYNTLDAIKWMILEGEIDDSVWMINAFSKYFRLSLSKGKDVVTINEELNLIRAYIGIMQKRFKDKFDVDYDFDEELMKCLIPKLSLQPMVENALQHGIMHSENAQGWLGTSVKNNNGRIIIEIKDNGRGMSQEEAATVKNNMSSNSEGYGLSNVDERLRLFGGDDCGLAISSELGKGTTVTISLPRKY